MRYKFMILGVTLGLSSAAHAASVTWGTPFELVSKSDIDLRYPVVYAVTGDVSNNPAVLLAGQSPASPLVVTVGTKTVSFEGVEGKYGAGTAFNATTFGDVIDHLPASGANVTFSTSSTRTTSIPQVTVDKLPTTSYALEGRVYATDTGDANLNTLLNTQVFFDGRTIGSSALNIQLNNLTAGKQYQLQIIGPADSRAGANTPATVTLNDGLGHAVTGISGFADLGPSPDGISHVVSVLGTFTAGGTSQSINAVLEAKRNGGVSAIIVTAVPEPTSMLLVGVGALGLLRRRQTRR